MNGLTATLSDAPSPTRTPAPHQSAAEGDSLVALGARPKEPAQFAVSESKSTITATVSDARTPNDPTGVSVDGQHRC